jgi:hypothetical protein
MIVGRIRAECWEEKRRRGGREIEFPPPMRMPRALEALPHGGEGHTHA